MKRNLVSTKPAACAMLAFRSAARLPSKMSQPQFRFLRLKKPSTSLGKLSTSAAAGCSSPRLRTSMKALTAAEMREVDRLTIERHSISGLQLMENAGARVAERVKHFF